MPAGETTNRHAQLDWLISSLRWLLLLGVAIVFFLDVSASEAGFLEADGLLPKVVLLVTGILYNAIVVFVLSCKRAPGSLPLLTLPMDTLLTIGIIVSSGGLTSPLLFFAVFPILIAALRLSQPASLLVALAIVAAFGGTLHAISPVRSRSDTISFVSFSVVLLLAAAVGSLGSSKVKEIASGDQQEEIEIERRKLRAAREHSKLTFDLASTLSATLNYNKVLRAVLEVAEKGVEELGREGAAQVGAVLLFAHNDLRVVASRHLSPQDRSLLFKGREGALEEALAKAEAVVIDNPVGDPELGKLASLRGCRQAIVVPLRAGFESFGVVIFAYTEAGIYTEDLVNLLTAICNQAIVALQNAQLYQDLREEKERIVAVEEDARKKLARNLHDGPTQSIASIAMRVSFARKLIEKGTTSDQISEELQKVENLARRTTKQIRHMLFTLRPLILETQGLRAALEQYISKLAETDDTEIDLQADPEAEGALSREVEGIVFYIVEEAISNARKHAQAGRIWVRLYVEDGRAFVVEVEDDGVGFDVDAVQMTYDRRGSLGLINMHERAEMTSGDLSIASRPGQGTQVRLVVPLSESL